MTAPDQPTEIVEPVTAAPAAPDPAIATGAPDPADEAKATEAPADRWVRFDGPEAQSVGHVGHWVSGEIKHVAGWLAERLLQHQHFTAADAPEADEAAEPAPVAEGETPAEATPKTSRRRPSPEGEPTNEAA